MLTKKLGNFVQRLCALLLGLVLTFGLCESLLRLHNPFPFRVRTNRIVLPVNQKYVLNNTENRRLMPFIVHTKNSLGFRGEEPPHDWNSYVKIIAVGGSTTEGFYLNDRKDWPGQLGMLLKKKNPHTWVNNAGLDGQSTVGHQVLLDDYLLKLRPEFILFLVGFNDVGLADLNRFEREMLYGSRSSLKRLLFKSETFVTALNIWRALMTPQRELRHRGVDVTLLPHHSPPPNLAAKELEKHRVPIIEYENRLRRLVDTCRRANITPVFITQPALYGVGKDDVTGVNLETVAVTRDQNGKTKWLVLEEYNETLRRVSRSQSLTLVDLAVLLPKSSRYFYDWAHFTETGAGKVAQIINHEFLASSSLSRYPESTGGGASDDEKSNDGYLGHTGLSSP